MTNIERVSAILSDEHHGALITSDVSRRYLCGFQSSAGVILITGEKSYLLIDSRYFDKARERVKDCEVILLDSVFEQLKELLIKHDIRRLSVESERMTLSELDRYREKLHFIDFDTTSALSDRLNYMRVIKTPEEVEKIKAAQRIAEKAYDRLVSNIRVGMTEKQVAATLDYYMMGYGADGLSFDTIAASGVNSASPHAVPTDKPLKKGEFLTLDFGALLDGYHSDMTRTLCVGRPTAKMEEVYNSVLQANLDAIDAVRPDICGKVVDSVARSTLNAFGGYEQYFGHGLGHGVGLEIHEAPTMSKRSTSMLKAGMIVTVEPGVYISGEFGVRIEDMVLVTENGCENLTETSKRLICV